jgi:hypothetical protein
VSRPHVGDRLRRQRANSRDLRMKVYGAALGWSGQCLLAQGEGVAVVGL